MSLKRRVDRLESRISATYDHEEAMAYWRARGQHLGGKIQAFFHGIPYEGEPPERPDFLPPPVEDGKDYKQMLKDRFRKLREANR